MSSREVERWEYAEHSGSPWAAAAKRAARGAGRGTRGVARDLTRVLRTTRDFIEIGLAP